MLPIRAGHGQEINCVDGAASNPTPTQSTTLKSVCNSLEVVCIEPSDSLQNERVDPGQRQRVSMQLHSQKASTDGAAAAEVRPTASRSASSLSKRTACRHCQRSGTQCRRHNGIYWCETSELPFDDWKRLIFPAKKAAAQRTAVKRSSKVNLSGPRSASSLSKRTACRHCRRSDTQCRRHQGIYWCEAVELPFDEWARSVFPAKKAAARDAAAKRSARARQPLSRPAQ